jgi:hypothetical protein
MKFNDTFPNMHGHLRIEKRDAITNELIEVHDCGRNAITYRAKGIMSRLLGAGLSGALNPSVGTDFDWGDNGASPNSPVGNLRITGMAVGNGGHLIYSSGTGDPEVLPKTGLVVTSGSVASHIDLPAMPLRPTPPDPLGSKTNYGYDDTAGQSVPGAAYEKVENGNVPWDGTVTIDDNGIGVSEPNTTLYSETFRFPLDIFGPDNDGIRFISRTEVQFKATLPGSFLNSTGLFGFAQQPANYVSEAGLIVGYCPGTGVVESGKVSLINDPDNSGAKDLDDGQLYSDDGNEPNQAAPASNNDNFDITGWQGVSALKDTTVSGGTTAFTWGTKPPTSVSPDQWSGGDLNNWNMLARKNFSALVKTNAFSLVFIWVISF